MIDGFTLAKQLFGCDLAISGSKKIIFGTDMLVAETARVVSELKTILSRMKTVVMCTTPKSCINSRNGVSETASSDPQKAVLGH